MCGIVGAISNKNIVHNLVAGLERLEYRGYDSAGIAILNGKIERVRSIGRVASIKEKVTAKKMEGFLGIGHTRWATHGGVTEGNAHPHISNQVVSVVHNGIIENYLELKDSQIKQGYKFTSDTDTEVIAHAIDFAMQSNNTLIHSVKKAIKTFEGSYGLGIISPHYPNTIIANRKGSPLVIGIGKYGN